MGRGGVGVEGPGMGPRIEDRGWGWGWGFDVADTGVQLATSLLVGLAAFVHVALRPL